MSLIHRCFSSVSGTFVENGLNFWVYLSKGLHALSFYTCLTLRLLFSDESSWIVCLWHSLVCSVAPDDSQLPFMLSCWCWMQLVSTFFFDSPIYLPLHEQSNWYTPGWLLGNSFGLFWHRMLCKFLPDVMSLYTILNSFLIFDAILGTHRIFFELV